METQNENKLAHELAEVLNDKKSLAQYISFTQKFSDAFLREKLRYVLSVPNHKIRNSRAAYFNYLVSKEI